MQCSNLMFSRIAGGMSLYVKPAEDGTSVGDCPFAHYVRMVLHEKDLEYDLLPTTQENKPNWLLEGYDGKLPALRHRRECYVDSDVITQYLDFFFQEPNMAVAKEDASKATAAVDGFFPAMAKFIKHSPNGDEEDREKQAALEEKLQILEEYLGDDSRTGPYLTGNGESFTLLDCSMAPKLYAMDVCLDKVKGNPFDLKAKYPAVRRYMDEVFARKSFQDTVEYGPETVVWGWTSYH
jgi:glutathione S-transferase